METMDVHVTQPPVPLMHISLVLLPLPPTSCNEWGQSISLVILIVYLCLKVRGISKQRGVYEIYYSPKTA